MNKLQSYNAIASTNEDQDKLRLVFEAFILAGGKSRRFGKNKALELLGTDNILSYTISSIKSLFAKLSIVTNDHYIYNAFGLPILPDIIPNNGVLGGIYTALHNIDGQYAFITACDMPYIKPEIVKMIIGHANLNYDVIIPRVNGNLQTLLACYSKNCLPYISELLSRNKLCVLDLFDKVKVLVLDENKFKTIDSNALSFVNINTPDDFAKAKSILYSEKLSICR